MLARAVLTAKRNIIPILLVILGASAAVISHEIRATEPWWSNLLANAGVVIFLLIPGDLLVRQARDATAKVERTANAAFMRAVENGRSLESIRSRLLARQQAEHEEALRPYQELTDNLSRETLLDALRQATEADIVSQNGVRSQVWETRLAYRYFVDEKDDLVVNVERDDQTVVSSTVWGRDVSAEDFMQTLVNMVRETGQDPGVGLNDPTHSIERLAEMLLEVAALRAQALSGHRETLRNIIERRDGWYFTESHIVRSNGYLIERSRLADRMWEDHLYQKGWADGPGAIEFARKLYRVRIL